MRVVVVGATGNVGTSLVAALAAEPRVTEIVGLARRVPQWRVGGTRWVRCDITRDALEGHFAGADAVVHLAWAIQPSRDERELERVNVDGSRRVFRAAATAGVGSLVYASSIGAYSRGPKDRSVDESWPTDGIPTSFYSRHKAATERLLDQIEAEHPALRVVRLRPALIFKADAATEIRRLFVGPLLPSPLVRPELLRVVPSIRGLRVQAVHTDDIADAYRRVLVDESARGAYNVAAAPVIDPDSLARELGAVKLPLPARAVRALTWATWRARLQPTPPGWLDMALTVPLLDTTRIETELGWRPQRTSMQALRELLTAMSRGEAGQTPPLAAATGGPGRIREFTTGVGGRNP